MNWRFATTSLVVLSGTLVTPGAQQAQPFRAAAEVVSIYATVTDQDRRLVPDLTKNDFVILDNGKKQPITVFSNTAQPFTVVVMLDRSLSMADHFELVEKAAGEFVRKLRPDDRARIGNFSEQIVISPKSFTGDHDTLLDILRNDLQKVGPSPVWTAVDRSITALLGERGRRVVLLFTDGHNEPERGQVAWDLKDVIHRAVYDEIMVYAIGLTIPETTTWPVLRQRNRGVIQLGSGRQGPQAPDQGLRKLAEQSGGGYFELTWHDNLAATFERVAEELHHQYWLGFPPGKLDGREHQIEVKVSRPGMTVQARKTYVASPVK